MLELETDYMTPLAITLVGRPAGSLTFNLESLPLGGTLEGVLPNLTYTPVENFSGTDFFTFSVSLDGETSQPAQVTIKVSSSGDTTKPTVLWSVPENGEMDVATGSTPVYTSPAGEVFSPILAAKFSEKLKEESITSDSVVVKDPGGTVVPSSSVFDPANNQLTIQLLTALGSETTYTVTLSNTIKDLAGNALTAYAWEFTTEAGESAGGQIFLPMITR
jgi:hypothetical protein